MPNALTTAFSTTLLSMLQIFFVALIAGVLVRKKVLSQDNIQGLSVITVDVFLPALIFSNILSHLKPGEFDIWWVLPLSGIFMSVIGMGIGALFFPRELSAKRNMLPLTGIQNSGYLVLPMGAVLFPEQFELFSLYVFLFILGQNPLMWSIGKYMSTAAPDTRLNWRDLVTPPLLATLVALLFVFTGLRDVLMPTQCRTGGFLLQSSRVLLDAVELIGEATVPAATFILGAVLGSITFRIRPYLFDTIRVIWVKLILIPVLTVLVLYHTDVPRAFPLLAVFYVIQSAAAPAVSIIMQVKKYGGDAQKIGSILFVSYGVCLVTLPVWVAIWTLLVEG